MDHDRLAGLFLEVANLKRMPRSGWLLRGVPHVESVADHSFGVALVALVLAEVMPEQALDMERVLIMALLHDLAEVRLTDLPKSAARLISGKVKGEAEAAALRDLLAPLPGASSLQGLWQEFEDHASPEGRLVRDADKLEMMVQCLRYEQAGTRGLDDYWQTMDQHQWHFTLAAELYGRLRKMRVADAE